MLSYIINGETKLSGEVNISGSKNASLPILATSILNTEPVTFYNVPKIEDTRITLEILKILGCNINTKSDKIIISSKNMKRTEIPKEYMNKLRSTVILAGAMIGRFKKAKFSTPGGCNIGQRPIDLHIKAFKKLGIDVEEKNGYIECKSKKIKGNKITLDFPSVGATENIILAAVYSKGTTYIYNAAREPEIYDLAKCLKAMGAKIYGVGTSKITIIGVQKLHGTEYRIMPDRIEAGTLLCAAAITRGNITINNVNPSSMTSILYTLKDIGCKISIKQNKISLKAPTNIKKINITTEPYPGFPTDMQPIFGAVLTKSIGVSNITENIFENRFRYTEGLIKMGANIEEQNKKITITGVKKLYGSNVESNDLRGGAALVIAGIAAEGITRVNKAEYILRGYENLEEKLTKLGANIKLEKVI